MLELAYPFRYIDAEDPVGAVPCQAPPFPRPVLLCDGAVWKTCGTGQGEAALVPSRCSFSSLWHQDSAA